MLVNELARHDEVIEIGSLSQSHLSLTARSLATSRKNARDEKNFERGLSFERFESRRLIVSNHKQKSRRRGDVKMHTKLLASHDFPKRSKYYPSEKPVEPNQAQISVLSRSGSSKLER